MRTKKRHDMLIIENESAKNGTHYVYFANCETGIVKIGTTTNPQGRLKAVSARHHIPIKEYFLVEGDGELESHFHKQFYKDRVYSEWFAIDFEQARAFVQAHEWKGKRIIQNNNAIEEYSKQETETYIALHNENVLESMFTRQLLHLSAVLEEMVKGRIKKNKNIIKEFIICTFSYNAFLEKLNIKTGDEGQVILENIDIIVKLARIGFIDNIWRTEGKDDKAVYAMVKQYIDGGK